MNKFGIITPKTKYINVKINDQKAKKYILQQKIDYKLLQDYNLNNGPILKYSDTEEKLYNLNNIDITNVDFLQIVKNSNDEYLNNKKNVHQLYSAIGKFNYKKYFNNYYNYKYEMLISLLDGCHGLSGNDPIFYFDIEKTRVSMAAMTHSLSARTLADNGAIHDADAFNHLATLMKAAGA